MKKGKINVQILEPQQTHGIRTIDTTSSPNAAKPIVRSSAEVNKEVRHKAIDLLLEITSRWNESGVEIPQAYVIEVQAAIMNIRLG